MGLFAYNHRILYGNPYYAGIAPLPQLTIIGVLYNLQSGVLKPDMIIDCLGRVFSTTAVHFPDSGRLVYSLPCKVSA